MADSLYKTSLDSLVTKVKQVTDAPGLPSANDLALLATALQRARDNGVTDAVDPTLLRQAIDSILTKIKNLGTLTPNDTAFVGTALQRIAGPSGSADIDIQATARKTEINALKVSIVNDLTTLGTNLTAAFNSNAAAKTADFNTNAVNVLGTAISTTLLTPVISNTNLTFNLDGFITGWTNGSQVYSLITYDVQNRIVSWREAITQGSTTATYNYAATYDLNGSVTVTRTAV